MHQLHLHPLLPLLLLLALPLSLLAASKVSGEYDCENHESLFNEANPDNDANCLALLRNTNEASRFDECRVGIGNKICYLFLQEAPFIKFETNRFDNSSEALLRYQKPFQCGDPGSLDPSVGGIAFELHKLTASKDQLCIWAGPISNCTFNALVDFTHEMSDRYQFAVTGLLLETPQRQCFHEPSTPFIDNSMIIIGRNTQENPASKGPFYQLMRPFRWSTWGIFGGVISLFVIVCFAIAVRFHVLRGRSLVTAFFIFAGERDQAMAHETDIRTNALRFRGIPAPPISLDGLKRRRKSMHDMEKEIAADAAEEQPVVEKQLTEAEMIKKSMSFATKYGLAMTLFRISLLAFVAVFALFYEVAVVNFLFQQQTLELKKSVKSLSQSELREYSVLKNSALENVWNATVNPKGLKYDGLNDDAIPWKRCTSAAECIEWAADPKFNASFDVTFEVVGKHLIQELSSCDELTIFQTKDILYQFNAGWLYSQKVNESIRKQVDRDIVGLRILGQIRRLIDEEIGDFACVATTTADIGPFIILVPLVFFVFPPLLGTLAVLLCWNPRRTDSDSEKIADSKSDVEANDSKSSLPASTSGDIDITTRPRAGEQTDEVDRDGFGVV